MCVGGGGGIVTSRDILSIFLKIGMSTFDMLGISIFIFIWSLWQSDKSKLALSAFSLNLIWLRVS